MSFEILITGVFIILFGLLLFLIKALEDGDTEFIPLFIVSLLLYIVDGFGIICLFW